MRVIIDAIVAGQHGTARLGTDANVYQMLKFGAITCVVMLILGILAAGSEFRHRTIVPVLLAARAPVMVTSDSTGWAPGPVVTQTWPGRGPGKLMPPCPSAAGSVRRPVRHQVAGHAADRPDDHLARPGDDRGGTVAAQRREPGKAHPARGELDADQHRGANRAWFPPGAGREQLPARPDAKQRVVQRFNRDGGG